MNAIEEIVAYANKVKNHECENVYPGMAIRFTEASTVNDRIWQGDLALTITDSIPEGYKKVSKGFTGQLVHGNNQGAKHCLKTLDGVDVYIHDSWNQESLDGPCLVVNKECTIIHPVHGHVTIPAGFIVNCSYQRELDTELARERRARD